MSSPSLLDSFDALYNPPKWRGYLTVEDRKRMCLRIIGIMSEHVAGFGDMDQDRKTQCVLRVEHWLFRYAFSLEEYQDMNTLTRRFHSIFHLRRKVETTHFVEEETSSTEGVSSQPPKRQRVEQTEFLLGNQLGLIQRIYSFIDGLEALRHCSINRFTALNIKDCVQNLKISSNVLRAQGGSISPVVRILRGATHLTDLRIYEDDSSFSQDHAALAGNARLIKQLGQAFGQGLAKELRKLNIFLDLTIASSSSDPSETETRCLVEGLTKGHHSKLTSLRLRQFLPEQDTVRLAETITQGKLPSLRVLDLCGNGIGELGARALWLMLTRKPT